MKTVEEVRNDIPLTKKCIYADNGATTPVPVPVINAMNEYFLEYCANVERGTYSIALKASKKWNEARRNVSKILLNCGDEEFIFTKNLTEAANMVAYALEHSLLNDGKEQNPIVKWGEGDRIVSTIMEHHSNLMMWLRLAKHLNLDFSLVKPANDCRLLPELFDIVDEKTKFVAFQHVSNAVGTVHDVKKIIKRIKEKNPDCLVFVDGSQGPGHMPVNVKGLGCDFYGFSGHKGPLGPQGTGGLYVKKELIEKMEPMLLGGGIISDVLENGYSLADTYSKRFDAGTPNIPGLIGLGKAAEYVNEIGLGNIEKREKKLGRILLEELSRMKGIEFYGSDDDRGTITFNIKGWRSHDVSLALDEKNILTRAGHHCCIPLMRFLGIHEKYGGNVRISFHYYNTEGEVKKIIEAIGGLL
ncbi:MAG: cysteine desulfurase [Thermoplasmatales archaeon]|nr:cysteine desulfurase [Thermoplasmatales archaeon]